MKRIAAVSLTLVLALAACTGGGGGDDDGPSLPLPEKAPSARGPATGPALEPKVLLASSDELEELAGDLDTAQVERRSGAFVSGGTVVGYSVDDISGYDLSSGEQLWTSDLDLGGGTVCYVSEPDRPVKTFTVAFGESGFCPSLATIRVEDGKVLSTSDALSGGLQEFEGERAGGAVNHLFTSKGRDHVVDMSGVVWRMTKGEPEAVARLEDDSYFNLHPTPKGDVLIGTRLGDTGRCRVDAYALPSFEHTWTKDNRTLFPKGEKDCIIQAAPGSSTWLKQETADRYLLTQVDPDTGQVLGTREAPKDSGGKAAEGELDLASAANQFDRALGLPGGDTIFAQVRGLTRYSLESGKVAWDLDLSQLQLESTEDYPLTTVLPQGVTKDGYLVATVSNDTAAEVVAVDVEKGTLEARWAVPEEYRNGFQVEPGMTLFGDGVVLTRNFEQWESTFADYLDVEEPEGDTYDIGVFTFPEPAEDDGKAAPVPTAGPVETEVEALGGVETPKGAKGPRGAGALSTGSRVIAYADSTVRGLDPRSGKELWSSPIDDDERARVCSAGSPDRKVKTFTVAIRTGERGRCSTVVRFAASDGSELERIEVPAAAKGVGRVAVHDGVVHVYTGDKVVHRIDGGKLVEHARLANQPYSLERTGEDPALLISTSSLRGGREWAIDAYRLPSFEKAWSTTGTKVFGKVDPRNWVSSWRGNGLWVSTTFGDVATQGDKVKDVLASLDPATGRVVKKVGPAKRDYLADDLEKFSLTQAATSGYTTAGFEGGDVVLPQKSGIIRYSLAEGEIRWAVDTSSIMESMERDRLASSVSTTFDVINGGRTVLVILSNGISVEAMTLKASTGKITGRWAVPKASRNGLQASPGVLPFRGGFALVRNDASWDYVFSQSGREVPKEKLHDVGLFRYTKPTSD